MKKHKRHEVYDILERMHKLKVERENIIGSDVCPIYSPPQKCVRVKCLWFDTSDMKCWITNPKPKPVE